MTKIGRLLGPVFVLLAALPAAALVSVQGAVDRDKVGVGQDLVFTLTVVSDGAVDIQPPRPSDLGGFELIETWDASAVSQKLMPGPRGMDFQTQRRREFNYRLRPTAPGRQSIGAFDVSVDGKRYSTQPILVQVTSESQPDPSVPRGQGGVPGFPNLEDMMDDMDRAQEEFFEQLLRRRGQGQGQGQGQPQRPPPAHRTLPVNPNEAFFIQVEADKTDVYKDEQITVSWYIYTRGQLETLDRVKFPDLKGFWKEIIEEVPTIQFTEEIVNGVVYKKALLASHALFPTKPGVAVIDEYKIKSRVRMPVQGFGGMAFGRPYEFTKSSQRLKINVKPLPTEGRPANFTGAVGVFDVNAVVDASQVPVGQPFNLRVRFEGEGNAKGIELPAIDWPKTVEIYDTKSESRFFKNGRSYKEFSVLVIPREEGPLEIPPFAVGLFDPHTGKYYERSTAPIKLQVVASNLAAAGAAKRMDEPAATAPAKAAPAGDRLPEPVVAFRGGGAGAGFFNRAPVWAALYLAVFLALAFKARLELGGRARRRDLREILAKRYKSLDKTVRAGDPRKIGVEMTNLFSLVLGDVAGEAGASEEISKMLERMPPSLRRDFGADIVKKHEIFQLMAFAPAEALGPLKDAGRVRREVEESKSLLNKIVKNAGEDEHAPA